ncbi:DUF4249 domain-containing protein [Pontibacter sp. E15-1]|uniref:DUF4249 domain-containing protein n=1 Tax=Pontibacter sp. E15-1 TaxID=2919918 RepID=UPI001F4F9AA0|nr:DUF4249 domain-containing protein [Pontibacter sp. E15-1]MCJ8167263.1 DUF4249 domain-containing protein [Pontibacter sp. E15-1]
MGKYSLKSTLLFGLLVSLLGCEMEQDVPIPAHEPRLSLRLSLINLTPDTLLYISTRESQLFVGRSQGVLEDSEELLAIPDAQVELFDEAGQLVEIYTHTGKSYFGGGSYYWSDSTGNYSPGAYHYPPAPGFYEATKGFVPAPGARYTIRASAPGYKPIEATTTVPLEAAVSGVAFDGQRGEYGWEIQGNIRLTIHDKAGEQNYYRVRIYPVDSTYSRAGFSEARTVEDDINFDRDEKLRLGEVFSDESYTSGAIGFSSKISVTPEAFEYNNNNNNNNNNGNQKQGRKAKYLEVQVEQLSKEEYLFNKTLEAQWLTEDNPFAEYAQVYSNVSGGYGVLSGVTVSKFYVPLE